MSLRSQGNQTRHYDAQRQVTAEVMPAIALQIPSLSLSSRQGHHRRAMEDKSKIVEASRYKASTMKLKIVLESMLLGNSILTTM